MPLLPAHVVVLESELVLSIRSLLKQQHQRIIGQQRHVVGEQLLVHLKARRDRNARHPRVVVVVQVKALGVGNALVAAADPVSFDEQAFKELEEAHHRRVELFAVQQALPNVQHAQDSHAKSTLTPRHPWLPLASHRNMPCFENILSRSNGHVTTAFDHQP